VFFAEETGSTDSALAAELKIPPIQPHNFTIEFILRQLELKPLRGKEWSVSLF
jgi:hypothetical protein